MHPSSRPDAARSPRTGNAAAGNASDDENSNKPSLRARVARFFGREGPGGITVGAWASVAAVAVAVVLATWRDQRLQERAAEAEREVVTSSAADWRHAKREAKEAARDARSAASKWSKGL